MGSRSVLSSSLFFLYHKPAGRPVSDGYGFLISFIISITSVPCLQEMRGLFFFRMLSVLFSDSPLDCLSIMPDPTFDTHESAVRSFS